TIFFAATAGFLGVGYYLVYRQPRAACADRTCAQPLPGRIVKGVLWVATGLALAAVAVRCLRPALIRTLEAPATGGHCSEYPNSDGTRNGYRASGGRHGNSGRTECHARCRQHVLLCLPLYSEAEPDQSRRRQPGDGVV